MQKLNIDVSDKAYAQAQRFFRESGFKTESAALEYALKEAAKNLPAGPDLYDTHSIDLAPAEDKSSKTQNEWIAHFNRKNELMVSAPHVYRAAKTGSPELLDSLRKDFKDSWMVLGTRLGYSTQDLSGKVTHFYGSTQAQPITLSVGIIPVYQGENLQSVVEGNGLKYMQAFWHAADKPPKII